MVGYKSTVTHSHYHYMIYSTQYKTHMLILMGGKLENLWKTPCGTGENNTSNKLDLDVCNSAQGEARTRPTEVRS